MKRPTFRNQLSTLFDRNLAVLLGSPGSAVAILVQPLLIGYLVGLAWSGEAAAETTYFVLVLAAIYLGCMNACTAIVSERAIYERERMTGLRLAPYLLAKLQLFALVGLGQCLILLLVSAQWVVLPGGLFKHAATFVLLTVTSLTAASLGLVISAWSRTATMAVILVPVVVLPQIIFSRVVLGSRFDEAVLSKVGWLMISRWSYDALIGATLDFDAVRVFAHPMVLVLMLAILISLSAGKLWLSEVVR